MKFLILSFVIVLLIFCLIIFTRELPTLRKKAIAYAQEVNKNLRPELAKQAIVAIDRASKKVGVNFFQALALAEDESRFNPYAKGTLDEIGLYQIRLICLKDVCSRIDPSIPYDPSRLYEPYYNALVGLTYLKYYLNRYGNFREAVARYKSGDPPNSAGYRLADRVVKRYQVIIKRLLSGSSEQI